MRVAFAGTPDFAGVALERIHAAGFTVPLVLTQPDRPAGRGMKLQASPVKTQALAHGVAVAQPRGLRLEGRYAEDAAAARAALAAAQPDVVVVAAYGLILPVWFLELPRLGCINIHASLLPRWRGAAPIHRAIEAGDAETGVTIMQMDAGLDTGAMLLAERLPIGPDDTTAALLVRLAGLGGELAVRALQALAGGGLQAHPQPEDGVTYAHKVGKDEAPIDWRLPAAVIERRLRAFDPFPGASSRLGGETVKCWRGAVVPAPPGAAHVVSATDDAHDAGVPGATDAGVPGAPGVPGEAATGAPGEILAAGPGALRVACGVGALDLTWLQRPGGRRVPAAEFIQRGRIAAGMRFDLPPI